MNRHKQLNGSAAEVEAAFYDALNRADIGGLMALWADDEEIVCIHPGAQRLIGHAAIRASWEAIFALGGVPVRPFHLHATHNLMSAVHTVIEGGGVGVGVGVEGGGEGDNSGGEAGHLLATNVYVKTPRGWRLVLHHVSIAPGLAAPDAARTSVLH